jgi:hypothetical protein
MTLEVKVAGPGVGFRLASGLLAQFRKLERDRQPTRRSLARKVEEFRTTLDERGLVFRGCSVDGTAVSEAS